MTEQWEPRGAAGRVAAVQQQAWRTLRVAAVFVAAAGVAGLVGGRDEVWLALHLLLLGGVVAAISAATQLFAVTWSASPAPAPAMVVTQRWLLAAGALGIVSARRLDLPVAVLGASGSAVLAALVLLAVILWQIRRRAVTDRFVAAIDGYVVAIAVGVVGSAAGIALAAGELDGTAGAREAHIVANLFGFVGIVVLATLPTFVATQVRTKVSPRLSAARLRILVGAMAVGTLAATAGLGVDRPDVAAGGFGLYAVTIIGGVSVLPRVRARQFDWAGPRLVQLLCGIAWWFGAAAWATAAHAGMVSGVERLWVVLAVGGYAQLVIASLAYLGPIIRGRDHQSQRQAFGLTRSWWSVGAANVSATALALGEWLVAAIAIGLWLADVVVRGVWLARTVHPVPLPSRR